MPRTTTYVLCGALGVLGALGWALALYFWLLAPIYTRLDAITQFLAQKAPASAPAPMKVE